MNTDTETISTDRTLQLLADEQRRELLRFLIETDKDVVTVDDLVAAAAGPDPAETQRTRIEIHHVHLPKLDDAGVVDYDPEHGLIRYRSAESIEQLLGFVSKTLE
jgi:DNA-binding transcriptional ArsR family regulator